MNTDNTCVVVVPCSGIGKPFGTVSREAAYELCEELRPGTTRLVALAKLVLGDAAARELLAKYPAVTIDGCKQMCASKMVKQSGGTVAHEVAVLDVFRRHKDLKPEGIARLNGAGQELARVLAGEIAASLDDGEPPGHARLAFPDGKTGSQPVLSDSAFCLSDSETAGWKPAGHDRRDACPPAKLTALGEPPVKGAGDV
jgi:uncharacterized metal-binding protein